MARRPTIDNDQSKHVPPPVLVRYGTDKFSAILRLVVLPIEVRDVADMLNADFASTMQTLNAYEATRTPVRCTDYSVEAKLRCLGMLHTLREVTLTAREKEKVSAFLVAEIERELMNVEGARNRAKKFNAVLGGATFVPDDAPTNQGEPDDID